MKRILMIGVAAITGLFSSTADCLEAAKEKAVVDGFCRGPQTGFDNAWRALAQADRAALIAAKGPTLLRCAFTRSDTWVLRRADDIGLLTETMAKRMIEDQASYASLRSGGFCSAQFALDLNQLFPDLIDDFENGVLRFAESFGPAERRRTAARLKEDDHGDEIPAVDIAPAANIDLRACEASVIMARENDAPRVRGISSGARETAADGFATLKSLATDRERVISDILDARPESRRGKPPGAGI